jgi:UDP-N-acetylmuramate dehydrogenase
MFPDLLPEVQAFAPKIRGRLAANLPLSDVTWLRVGGPAQLFFSPADIDDLCYFLSVCPDHIPVMPIGVGSNLLVRDGGVPGIVIRLGRGFNEARIAGETEISAGAGLPDMRLAQAAAKAGIAGLSFFRGIPGTVGGALRMNAGAHGGDTRRVLKQARAVSRDGVLHSFTNAEMGFSYRNCALPQGMIFVDALFEGERGDSGELEREMQDVADYREANQPIKSRTGGSTFKNPPGASAWKLIDEAGCRGLRIGGVHMSEMHCNVLINDGDATAFDVETLGETVRRRVFEHSGVELEWEIKRIGIPASGSAFRAAAE